MLDVVSVSMINLYFCLLLNELNFMKKQKKRWFVLIGYGLAVVTIVVGCWLFLMTFSSSKQHSYIYIDKDDTVDSVYAKIATAAAPRQMLGLRLAVGFTGYAAHVVPGCYDVGGGVSTFRLFRNLRGGRQTPVNLTIPNVRTMEDLAARLSKQLGVDSATLANAFSDEALCEKMGCTVATLPCLFIPDTSEVFWTITPEQLLERMKKECQAFWTDQRKTKALAAGLTEEEVITLASIVDQETAVNAEKTMVAGMYLNRLRKGMKLQADPTVKFALRQFALKRIMHEHLTVDSPYNTYRNEGLPPGPISIPSRSSIEAVLDYSRHDYIYMCAKEDFSGTHNFAVTYEEHLKNAKKYAKALDNRNIH